MLIVFLQSSKFKTPQFRILTFVLKIMIILLIKVFKIITISRIRLMKSIIIWILISMEIIVLIISLLINLLVIIIKMRKINLILLILIKLITSELYIYYYIWLIFLIMSLNNKKPSLNFRNKFNDQINKIISNITFQTFE
jgi:hypothetical protein